MRSPAFMIASRLPGTSFQSKPLPSPVQRGIRCRWKCGTDWKAAAPLAWSRLSPSGLSAVRMAPRHPLGRGHGRLEILHVGLEDRGGVRLGDHQAVARR